MTKFIPCEPQAQQNRSAGSLCELRGTKRQTLTAFAIVPTSPAACAIAARLSGLPDVARLRNQGLSLPEMIEARDQLGPATPQSMLAQPASRDAGNQSACLVDAIRR
jgi:hypothetical protein